MKNFHDHLDQCQQCRDHPFALCPIGASIITEMYRAQPTKSNDRGITVPKYDTAGVLMGPDDIPS